MEVAGVRHVSRRGLWRFVPKLALVSMVLIVG
jgi:hypothetical protein